MSYVWINPVVASMYDAYVLDKFLQRYGHRRIEAKKDWGVIVKEKYKIAVKNGEKPVVDMRCPKIRELLTDMDVTKKVMIPEIPPILIHCGQEISKMEELRGEEKIITTPCQALADMGNSLGLENTWFVTWNQFVKMTKEREKEILQNGSVPEKSPIPPGFFDELMLATVSLTGENEIRSYFKENNFENAQLIEALYCKNGCHNGDGIGICV